MYISPDQHIVITHLDSYSLKFVDKTIYLTLDIDISTVVE